MNRLKKCRIHGKKIKLVPIVIMHTVVVTKKAPNENQSHDVSISEELIIGDTIQGVINRANNTGINGGKKIVMYSVIGHLNPFQNRNIGFHIYHITIVEITGASNNPVNPYIGPNITARKI